MVNPRALTNPGRLKVFLVAGEASGDAYGAQLLKDLNVLCLDKGLELDAVGWGGDLMAAEGLRMLNHIDEVNFMGFWEVAQNLRAILQNLQLAKNQIVREEPDAVITIDFPGFNMRLAKALRELSHPAMRVQWVAPQVWAWKPKRAKKLARDFHAVAPILPFESSILQRSGVMTWNVGHPLLDLIPEEIHGARRPVALALLPGSRKQELKQHLPILVKAAIEGAARGMWSMNDIVLAGAPGRALGDYDVALQAGIDVRFGQTHHILKQAQRAWVASGTATLEAGLLNTPHVLVYKTSWLTYQLAKRFARIQHIGLPNILLNQAVVPELIQDGLNADALLATTNPDLDHQIQRFEELRAILGGRGATNRLAHHILACFE